MAQYEFAGDELIALLLGQAVGLVEQARQVLRQVHVASGVLDLRQRVHLLIKRGAQRRNVKADLHQQGLDGAALLLDERGQQVHRLDGRVVMSNGQGLGVGEGKLELAGQTVDSHEGRPSCLERAGAMSAPGHD